MANEFDEALDQESAGTLPPLSSGLEKGEFDDVLDTEVSQQQSYVRNVIDIASKDNPEAAAERVRLSQSTGLPPDVVARNQQELKRREIARAIDLQRMMRDSPVLFRQMTDPTFTAAAIDDLDTLRQIEQSFTNIANYAKSGEMTSDAGGAARSLALGGTVGVGKMIFDVFGAATDLVGLDYLSGGYRTMSENARQAMDAYGLQADTSTGRAVKSGLESAGQNLALLPLGLERGLFQTAEAAGAAVAGAMSVGVGADSYQRARGEGVGRFNSALYGINDAGVEFLMEKIPAGQLFKGIELDNSLLKQLAQQTVTEGWTEQVTTLAQDFNEWMALHPEKTTAEFLAERPEAAYQTFIATLIGTGVQTTAIAGINKLVEKASDQALVYEQDRLKRQLQLAGMSALRERSPEQFRANMEQVVANAPDGAPTEIHVDAEVLNQLTPEMQALLPEAVRAQIPDALAMNATVPISMADVLTIAPGTELEQILNDNARVGSPEAPSRVEAEKAAEFIQQDAERVLQQAQDQSAWQTEVDTVQQTIKGQLDQAGRFTSDVNESYARLQSQFFSVMASRFGVMPSEMYERFSLKVAGQMGQGEVLNAQYDQGDVPVTDQVDPTTGLPLNADGTVTLYHHTSAANADNIRQSGALRSAGEPDVYLTTRETPDTGYGDTAVKVRVDPRKLQLDDEFADGRMDFRISVGRPGGALTGAEFNQSATIRQGKETLKKYGLDPTKSYKTREVAAALEARQRTKYGTIATDNRSETALANIAKWMVAEVEFEMQNPEKSGVGWYSEKFQRALDIMGDAFPELKTDKTARNTMTALIAITSDGQKVVPNFAQAMDIYGNFRETGQFTTTRGHQRQASIDNNLKVIQRLHDTMGAEAMHEYLMQEDTISELKKKAKAAGGEMKSDYQAHIKMPQAAVEFGPKLGAFYANLMGAHGYLTMDRWWSRTFNRYRGTLLTAPTRQGLDRFKQLLGNPELSDDEALAATVEHRKSYEAKGFKNGTEIEKAANTVGKAAFDNLEDAPFNATDRTFMLDAVNKAQKALKRKGINLSIADIQAILWYYEKRLYGELGARQTADISYEEAAQRVASGYASGSGIESLLDDTGAAPVSPLFFSSRPYQSCFQLDLPESLTHSAISDFS